MSKILLVSRGSRSRLLTFNIHPLLLLTTSVRQALHIRQRDSNVIHRDEGQYLPHVYYSILTTALSNSHVEKHTHPRIYWSVCVFENTKRVLYYSSNTTLHKQHCDQSRVKLALVHERCRNVVSLKHNNEDNTIKAAISPKPPGNVIEFVRVRRKQL